MAHDMDVNISISILDNKDSISLSIWIFLHVAQEVIFSITKIPTRMSATTFVSLADVSQSKNVTVIWSSNGAGF